MKKLLFASLILAGALSVFADSFTDIIQDLAKQTACIGMYSMTEAGGGWYDDPHDYYTPQMMAERFAKMSGNMTRTATFYGVCFDYAQFAYNDIARYEGLYKQNGMYENKYWIAGVHDNPNKIQLQSPGTANNHTTIQNGVYVNYPNNSNNGQRNVKTHRLLNKGERATGHAWLWVERADGVEFWIDPTWTDNLGYVVYGYVSNGEEIQCRPDKEYCINYPDALNNLPLPPPMGARKAPSKSANSTNRNEIINDSGTDWITASVLNEVFVSVNVPFSAFADKSLSIKKMGFSLEACALKTSGFSYIGGLEYLQNIGDDYRIHSGLITWDYLRKITNNIAWYGGGGVGLRFDALNKNKHYAPDRDPSDTRGLEYKANTGWFAFKANTGVLFSTSWITTKIDVAYDNVMGFSAGLGLGFNWQ